MNSNIFAIVKLDPTSANVYAQVSDGAVAVDTHNSYDRNKGIYTIPETGIYNIQTQVIKDGHIHTNSIIKSLKAGDIEIIIERPLLPGDCVILKNDFLLEIVSKSEFGDDSYLAKVIDQTGVGDFSIGGTYLFTLRNYKIVPKDTNLQTYRLLYVK